MNARFAAALLLLTGLACSGLAAKGDLTRWIARAELQDTPPSRQLGRGMEAVAMRCDVGGDLETERCEAIAYATELAVIDGEVTDAEVTDLLGRFPELDAEPPVDEPGYERLRTSIDGNKRYLVNDFRKWTPDELPGRLRTLDWGEVSCDDKTLPGGGRQRCRVDIGPNALTVRLYGYESTSARDADNEDTYLPGASETRDTHILNVRVYDETRTKLVAKEMGLLDDDLKIQIRESWVKRKLREVVEEVYLCETVEEAVVCYGGDEAYDDTMELEVGKDVEGEELYWSGVSLTRTLADGTYAKVETIGHDASELRLDELLDARPAKEAAPDLPDLVATCVHWAGEEPTDDERAQQIATGVRASCEPATAWIRSHPERSLQEPADAAAVVELLALEGDTLGVDRQAACVNALVHHRAQKEAGSLDLSLSSFPSECPEQAAEL